MHDDVRIAGLQHDQIPPVFAPTGWRTVALDQITFEVADYKKEAAFYIAVMGWTLRRDDGKQAVLDIGEWGTVVFRQAPAKSAAASGSAAGKAVVTSFGFAIEPWNARRVEAELRKRGLSPVADNGANGFESFHVKDPDGFDLQIGNGNGHARDARHRPRAKLSEPLPLKPDRMENSVAGSLLVQLEELQGERVVLREPAGMEAHVRRRQPARADDWRDRRHHHPRRQSARDRDSGDETRHGIDHISFGIAPWDTDGVKRELETRGLKATIDTSSRHKGPDGTWEPDEIHTAAFKSYHTDTPNGYNLQISYVTHNNRLALANAVNPKTVSGAK